MTRGGGNEVWRWKGVGEGIRGRWVPAFAGTRGRKRATGRSPLRIGKGSVYLPAGVGRESMRDSRPRRALTLLLRASRVLDIAAMKAAIWAAV